MARIVEAKNHSGDQGVISTNIVVLDKDGNRLYTGSDYDEAKRICDAANAQEEKEAQKEQQSSATPASTAAAAQQAAEQAKASLDNNLRNDGSSSESPQSSSIPSVPGTESSTDAVSSLLGGGDSSSSGNDAITGTNPSENTSDDDSLNQRDVAGTSDDPQAKAGLDYNNQRNKGRVYPLIRINDHYFQPNEIVDFYIETGYYKNYHEYKTQKIPRTGFIPTIGLVIRTSNTDLLKNNQIKAGDKIGVFMSPGGGMIKSYRGDYVITSCTSSKKQTEVANTATTFIIKGELFVPNLRTELEKQVIQATSRDALMQVAQLLGLGFFFSDSDNTNDYQGWPCTTNLYDYALEISTHAWKEFNAFFDCWIDPRYGMSFINVNKMLGVDGLDEMIDVTPFVSTIVNPLGVDGEKIEEETEEQKKKNARPQPKLLTNIQRDDESATPFYVKNFHIVNRAGEITNEIGVNSDQKLMIDNSGVETPNTGIDMSYSIPINMTKLQNGFFVLMGPGVNLTYNQADQALLTQSYTRNQSKMTGGTITEVMSDNDAQQMEQTGSNMMASGNVNKFYDAGWEHNMRNLLQLQKQYMEVDLMGLNLGIMRGEKIPMILIDHDTFQKSLQANAYTGSILQNSIYELGSGWYIIDGLMWKWSQDDTLHGSTYWTTKLRLVRREWPIPGRIGNYNTSTDAVTNATEVATGNQSGSGSGGNSGNEQSSGTSGGSSTNQQELGSTPDNLSPQEQSQAAAQAAQNPVGSDASEPLASQTDDTGSEMPTTGLKAKAVEVYKKLKDICPGVKMVSGRRWAVDENGKRTDGNAYVMKNGLYKCCNAKGQIMYFSNNNSRHLYGEAFDVVNSNGTSYTEIWRTILSSYDILNVMAQNGFCAFTEMTKDDLGTQSKHIHFGTDQEMWKKFWDNVKTAVPDMYASIKVEQTANKLARDNEIKRQDVEEKSE